MSNARAWYAVILLIMLYCVALIDRMILALIASDVAISLDISKTELGLLFGVGFGALYALVGLPIAQLIDRSHRIRIVCAGVVLWSACTVGSAFAGSYAELLIMRSGVAIGEAVLSPAAVSIIADIFPREKRGLPTSLYASVGIIMGSGAFIIGGGAVDLGHWLSAHCDMEIWRLVLVLVGMPGFLIAFVLGATVREPIRSESCDRGGNIGKYDTTYQAIEYIKRERRLYGCLFVAAGAYGIIGNSYLAWSPTMLIQTYGFATNDAGYIFGSIGIVSGLIGALGAVASVNLLGRAGLSDALLIIFGIGCALGTLCAVVIGFSRLPMIGIWAMAGVTLFGNSVAAIIPPLIVQYVSPAAMKARILAGYLMATNLVGLTIGPALVAWMSEHVFEGVYALPTALGVVAAIFGPVAIAAIYFARASFIAAQQSAADSNSY